MANKTQAKNAVDSAATAAKSFIDNNLPTGVNIRDGDIQFNPQKTTIRIDAGGSQATADSWSAFIQSTLTSGTFTVVFWRRSGESPSGEKTIKISTQAIDCFIVNF